MKRFFTLMLATTLVVLGSGNSATAQVEQGSILIDLYYGFPNATKSFYQGLYGENENATITGLGGLGGRFEYMVSDNLGVGIDGNYVTGSASYSLRDTLYDSNGNDSVVNVYGVERSVSKTRIMARINYHFVATDVVDAYVGFGAGYKLRNTTWTTTDPNGVNNEESGLFDGLFPVAVRVALGTRFYFTENIGINMELGLGGGPVVSGGLALKF